MSVSLTANPPTKESKSEGEKLSQDTPKVEDCDEESGENCSICLQFMEDRTIIPNCSHEFCFDCLMIWTAQSRRCPLCTQAIGDHVIHDIGSRFDYRKHHLAPLRSNSPQLLLLPQTTAAIEARNAARRRRRERERDRRQREEMDEQDKLELSIATRRWIYKHDLYAKHFASNSYTKYRPYPTPTQFASSQDLVSRTTSFLRRELQVWQGLDVEFLTNLIISLMKAIDIRSESAVKLLAEFLDLDAPYETGKRHINAEHFAHEVYSYVRSPYRDLFVYDSIVQYDHPRNISPPPQLRQQSTRWHTPLREISRSRDRKRDRSRSPPRSPRQERGRSPSREQQGRPRNKHRRHTDTSSPDTRGFFARRNEESIKTGPTRLGKQKARSSDHDDIIDVADHGNKFVSSERDGRGRRELAVSGDSSRTLQSRGQSSHDFMAGIPEFDSSTDRLEVKSSSLPRRRHVTKDNPQVEQRSPTPEFQDITPNEKETPLSPRPQKKDLNSRRKGGPRQKSLLESIQTHLKTNPPIPRSMKPTSGRNPSPPLHVSSEKISHYQTYQSLLQRLSCPATNIVDEPSTRPDVAISHQDRENGSGISTPSPTSEIELQAISNIYPISNESASVTADVADHRYASTNHQRPSALDGGHQDNVGRTDDRRRASVTPALETQPPVTSNPNPNIELAPRDIDPPTNCCASTAQIRASDDKCLNSVDGREEVCQSDKAHVGSALYHATSIFAHDPPNSAPFILTPNHFSKETSQSRSELRLKLMCRLEQERQEAMNSQKTKSALGDKREQISLSGSPTDTGDSFAPVRDNNTMKYDTGAIRNPRRSVEDCLASNDESLSLASASSGPDATVLEARFRARARLRVRLAAEKQLGKSERPDVGRNQYEAD